MALALAATLMCLPGASLAEDAAATDAPAAIEETTTTVAEDPNEVLATVNGNHPCAFQHLLSVHAVLLWAVLRHDERKSAGSHPPERAGSGGAV